MYTSYYSIFAATHETRLCKHRTGSQFVGDYGLTLKCCLASNARLIPTAAHANPSDKRFNTIEDPPNDRLPIPLLESYL